MLSPFLSFVYFPIYAGWRQVSRHITMYKYNLLFVELVNAMNFQTCSKVIVTVKRDCVMILMK